MQLTVGHTLKLVEGSTSETFVTVMTIEMFDVPLSSKSVDTIATNRLIARSTARRKDFIKALFTVRSVITFKEIATLKW
jgi:hypothetical protein